KPEGSNEKRTFNRYIKAANDRYKTVEWNLKYAEADDKQLAAEGELKFDEEVFDNCYRSDEVMVVMEAPLDECDSNDADNINGKIKKCERGVNEKQEDTNRKVIANKKGNKGAYGVKNKNVENILIYDNETAQNVKPNLVFIEHEVLGYAGEAFDTIEDF
ncbi:9137_t:CDS:2, partial [Racocetra persica]